MPQYVVTVEHLATGRKRSVNVDAPDAREAAARGREEAGGVGYRVVKAKRRRETNVRTTRSGGEPANPANHAEPRESASSGFHGVTLHEHSVALAMSFVLFPFALAACFVRCMQDRPTAALENILAGVLGVVTQVLCVLAITYAFGRTLMSL